MRPSLRMDTNIGSVYLGKFVPKTTVEPNCGSPLPTMGLSVNIVEHNPIVTRRARSFGRQHSPPGSPCGGGVTSPSAEYPINPVIICVLNWLCRDRVVRSMSRTGSGHEAVSPFRWCRETAIVRKNEQKRHVNRSGSNGRGDRHRGGAAGFGPTPLGATARR